MNIRERSIALEQSCGKTIEVVCVYERDFLLYVRRVEVIYWKLMNSKQTGYEDDMGKLTPFRRSRSVRNSEKAIK